MLSISDAPSEDEIENSKSRHREANHKMKLRSIRLSRLPSIRSCMRLKKSPSCQSPSLLSGYAASTEESTPIVISDASQEPNYIKPTSCSNAKNGNFQKPSRMLSSRSTFKPVKSPTRVSSTKFRRLLMRVSSRGIDQKNILWKTRSIKIASIGNPRASSRKEENAHDQPSILLTSKADTSETYSKAHLHSSLNNPESSIHNNDQNRRNSKIAKSKSDSSARVFKRSTTLRPQRFLTKTASLKPKRPSKKCSEFSEDLDLSVVRATCSSTLKKFSPVLGCKWEEMNLEESQL
ncbi:uncharacterized protein LOC123225107 isoform X3 [Mangifera indica]|nr:uncharacterized protein LOC123225107 isoform X3 [Mangifera indica]